MAVRFRSYTFETYYGNSFKIEIDDADFSGTVYEFDMQAPGFEISWDGDLGDRHGTISASTLKFWMIQDLPVLRNFVNDLATGNEKRFTVAVYKSSTLFWAGHIMPDASNLEDREDRVFEISAACGLGTLKKIDYLQSDGSKYTGQARLVDVIARCLKNIPHVPTYFASADPFLVTSDNCYEVQHTVSSTYDPLYYTYIDQGLFVKRTTNGKETPMSCFDVLHSVLLPKMLNLRLAEGIWRARQVETYAFTSYWRKYAYAIGSPAAYTAAATLGGNPTNPRTGVTYGHLAPINKVKVTQNVGALRNIIEGDIFSSDGAGAYTYPVFCDGENSTLQFSGDLEWRLKNLGVSGTLGINFPHYLIFTFTLKIGTRWLRRTINFVANGAAATEFKWVALSGPSKLATKQILPLPAIGEYTNDTTPFNYIVGLHSSQTDGQTMELTYAFEGLYRSNGVVVDPADYEITWKVFNPYFILVQEPTDKADKIAPKDKIEYIATNATPGNTAALEYETIIGDPEDLNSYGALHYYNGSGYFETADWALRAAGGDGKLMQVLASRIAAGQAVPLETMSGSVDGASIYQLAHTPREEYSKKWQLARGTYTAQDDRFSGDWYVLDYTDDTPTIEIPPYDPGEYGLTRPPSPVLSTPGKSMTFEPQSIGAMTAYVGRISDTADFLAEGAITSVPTTDALAGGEILTGDTIYLFNPVTNASVECTVTGDVTDGATSIAVTATIPEGGMPTNSTIIYGWASRFQQGGTKSLKVADTATVDLTLTGSTNTLTADVIRQMSITADASGLKLSGDASTPGNSKYYGTDGTGTKGFFSLPSGGGTITGANNGLSVSGGTTIQWGGTLIQDTTITQSTFKIRFTGNYTGIHKTANNPTPYAVLHVDGRSVDATSTASPNEDAIINFSGTVSTSTQVNAQLSVGGYATNTNGMWLQSRSMTSYSTFYPLRLQPLGGKVGIGKFGATPPTAYCTIFGSGLGTSGLSASTLHVAQTGESSTTARISLGTNDTLSVMWMYDGAAQINRIHTAASGTTVTRRWSFGNTEFGDVMTLVPSAAASLSRLGVGFANTTGLHSTLHSAGSFAGAMLETAGAPTFDETKYCVVYTGSTNQTYTLPSASSCTGRVYWINHSGSAGTITFSLSVSVGNGVTFTTLAAGEWCRIQAGIGSWRGKKW